MKFKYNNKTYYVFADKEEVDTKAHIIKINEDYLLDHFSIKNDELGKACYYLNKSKYTELTTTQVLAHITNKRKILIAYEVNNTTNKEIIRVYYAIPNSIDINNLLNLILGLKPIKDKVLITHKDDHVAISLNQEETEEEVKERVTKSIDCRCVSEVDKIKYFIV